jgi:hypothetical protein
VVIACQLAVLGGCGNSRTPVASFTRPAAPRGFHTLSYSSAGVAFRAPRNWTTVSEPAPVVTVLSSGTAVVAVWRYPRSTPQPDGGATLASTRSELIAAARAHDRDLRLIDSKLTSADGAPAIELDAIERIAGQQRRVRSTHVYANRAEIVLDEYAPPASFGTLDREVFSPLDDSLRLLPLR